MTLSKPNEQAQQHPDMNSDNRQHTHEETTGIPLNETQSIYLKK